ncbi:MAG: hypothetical protein KI792_14265 [Alphaproteobacteria bacterium]|nr:hypothetical protein [Alphaproteobacteria bacterium SS10]
MIKHLPRTTFLALALLSLSGCGTMGAILGTAVGVMKTSVDVLVEAPAEAPAKETEVAAAEQSAG